MNADTNADTSAGAAMPHDSAPADRFPQSELEYLQRLYASQTRELDSMSQRMRINELENEKLARDLNTSRGLLLDDLDVDELRKLRSAQQEASDRVDRALERREAEERVAKDQERFLCPIGLGIMRDPVVAIDGHTYERKYIEQWLRITPSPKSPMTGSELRETALIPNHALRTVFHDAVDAQLAITRRARAEQASVGNLLSLACS